MLISSMDLNKILGIIPNIKNDIYESQRQHLLNGVVLVSTTSIPLGINTCGKLIPFEIQAKIPFFRTNGKKDDSSFFITNQMSPLFFDDLIRVDLVSPNKYIIRLIKEGASRSSIEKDLKEPQCKIINESYKSVKLFLSNLTIESFVQFDYIDLFKKININDSFFENINKSNYESLEENFNKKMKEIISNEIFTLELKDIYFYKKPFFFDSVKNKIRFSQDFISFENKWNKDKMEIVCD